MYSVSQVSKLATSVKPIDNRHFLASSISGGINAIHFSYRLVDLQKEIEKTYTSLGESLYLEWLKVDIDHAVFTERLENIRAKKEEIDNLKMQLNSIDDRDNQILGNGGDKNPLICSRCGAQFTNPVKFCGKCGSKMD